MNWNRPECLNLFRQLWKIYVVKPNSLSKRFVLCIEALRRQVLSSFSVISSKDNWSFLYVQECPEGVVHEDCFKDIYAKFFPHGSKILIEKYSKSMEIQTKFIISFPFPLPTPTIYFQILVCMHIMCSKHLTSTPMEPLVSG